jgi:hypothetical protein
MYIIDDGVHIPRWDDINEIKKSKEVLIRLQKMGIALTEFMEEKYIIKGKNVTHIEIDGTQRLVSHFLKRKTILKENRTRGGADNTSYTINKGEEIHMCLRDPNTKQLIQDNNIIDFVMFHELAHVACPKDQHEDEFWVYFKLLLSNAVEAGLYVPVDYSKAPLSYCGLDVTYNPLYDKTLQW